MLKLKHFLSKRARILLMLCALGAAIGYTGSWHWVAELLSHFFLQYWLIAAGALLVLLWAGDRKWSLAGVAILTLLSLALAPYYFPLQAAAATERSAQLTVLQFNAAQNPSQAIPWLEQNATAIDLVILIEATPEFQDGIARLHTHFPHQLLELRDGPFGIALLSRHPLSAMVKLDLAGDAFPALAAQVLAPGWTTPLHVFAIHPPPPVNSELAQLREQYLTNLAGVAARSKKDALIVAGDFNATPWSPLFRRFMQASALQDSQSTQGLLSTWPAATARYTGMFGLPIDALLHSDKIGIAARGSGPYLDSDHLPVITTIYPRDAVVSKPQTVW